MQVMFLSPEAELDLREIYQIDKRFLEEEYHRRYKEHLAVIVAYQGHRLGSSPCTDGTCKDDHVGTVDVKVSVKLNTSPPFSLEFVHLKKEG